MSALRQDLRSQSDFTPIQVDAPTAARRLLGCILERQIDGVVVRVRIIETEAYDQSDSASHAVTGPTGRAKSMFMSAGHSYIYLVYGMHHCCNIVTGSVGFGSGALVRAVEPLEGVEVLSRRRGSVSGLGVTNGPAKLCQALGITRDLDGHDLHQAPLRLVMQPAIDPSSVVTTTRIGITKAIDTRWRFYIKNSLYVSAKGGY